MTERTPSYYAVIPASVRYDDKISANAKLLYGEISALIGREGFCYASNAHFASLYQVSERTITSWVAALKDGGYIKVHMDRDDSGQVVARRLYLSESIPDGQPLEENFYTPRRNFREGIEENFQYTNLSNTDIEKENKKERSSSTAASRGRVSKADFDPKPVFVSWITDIFPDETSARKNQLFFAMVRLSDNRAAMKKQIPSQSAVTALCNKLLQYSKKAEDRLSCMIDLLDTAVASNWLTVYPQKSDSGVKASKATGGRRYECL